MATVNRYASRKFWLTVVVLGNAIVGLWTKFIDQEHFVVLASLTLGMYKAAQIADDRLNGTPESNSVRLP